MKILLLSSFYPPIGRGGAEKAASLLAEALVQAGYEVVVITFQPGREQSVKQLNGVRVHRIPLDNLYFPLGQSDRQPSWKRLLWHLRDRWNPAAAARVGRILDQEQPDVVHSHVLAGFSVAVWREVKRRRIRLVHTLHDYYMLCIRSSMFTEGHACTRQCTGCRLMTSPRKSASGSVDHVVSVSDYVLAEHHRFDYFPAVASSVQFNVLDSIPNPAPSPQPGPGLTFGFIGKIEEPKGIGLLLEATLLLKHPDWRLRIAGAGFDDYANELKARFTDPRIEWLGFIPQEDFFRSIDVAIVPSVWADPITYVAVEALFAGRSLLCARSGGIPEIAALARTVAVFPSGDASALAAVMDQALADPVAWRTGGFLDPVSTALFAPAHVAAAYTAIYI